MRITGALSFNLEAFSPCPPHCDRLRFDGDEQLKAIYDISKYTLKLCSRMFFLDGIKRDRWPWAGDACLTACMSYYSLNDTETVKRTLIVLRGNNLFNSLINNILGFSSFWVRMLADYELYSGDRVFIQRKTPMLHR